VESTARRQERRRREHRAAKDDQGEAFRAYGLGKRDRAAAHQTVGRKAEEGKGQRRDESREHEDENDAIADHARIMRPYGLSPRVGPPSRARLDPRAPSSLSRRKSPAYFKKPFSMR
jgi:hypothetical protein